MSLSLVERSTVSVQPVRATDNFSSFLSHRGGTRTVQLHRGSWNKSDSTLALRFFSLVSHLKCLVFAILWSLFAVRQTQGKTHISASHSRLKTELGQHWQYPSRTSRCTRTGHFRLAPQYNYGPVMMAEAKNFPPDWQLAQRSQTLFIALGSECSSRAKTSPFGAGTRSEQRSPGRHN